VSTVDTSVLVAAFARWHEHHDAARAAVADADVLIAHVGLETFSVLTRLPAPRRAESGLVVAFLRHHFPADPVTLSAAGYTHLLDQAVGAAVEGGAIYDALVAATAAEAATELLSLDRRAVRTYRALGAAHRLIA
jgi:predicted nucleic acid-binding protein